FGITKVRRRSTLAQTTLLLGMCGAAVAIGSALASGLTTASADTPTRVAPPAPTPVVQAAAVTPQFDAALALLAEARQTYGQVHDYSCTLVSQERLKGNLEPEHVIGFKFRKQPFSVAMHWHAPQGLVGQELCFVQGRNKDKMRVHPAGAL